jgi:bifunctional DNA-binding transcriptional regulator/antitoxin component of YhaV-PrlF toxin-antitoxin module
VATVPSTLEGMTLSTQQRAIILERHTSSLEATRPRLAPQASPSLLPVAPPLYLVSERAPALQTPKTRVTPTFSIVAMDAFRFPINEARKSFGWKAGKYLNVQVEGARAFLRLSTTESEIQVSPNGRIMLPFWVRRRLLVEIDDQLLLQHSIPGQEACLSICTASELFFNLSALNEGSDQL